MLLNGSLFKISFFISSKGDSLNKAIHQAKRDQYARGGGGMPKIMMMINYGYKLMKPAFGEAVWRL
jgi:molecular chaperone GrpE (heat shock protein)